MVNKKLVSMQGCGFGMIALQVCTASCPCSIMMSPGVVNYNVGSISISVVCLLSALTARKITNCFAGNRHCTHQNPVQPEQNPILKLIFLPFCTELYYHQARCCSTDGKVHCKYAGAREVGVALPKMC